MAELEREAYGLLLLNLEGVRSAVTRVGALPLPVKLGSEARGFVCLPVRADSFVKTGTKTEHINTADSGTGKVHLDTTKCCR